MSRKYDSKVVGFTCGAIAAHRFGGSLRWALAFAQQAR